MKKLTLLLTMSLSVVTVLQAMDMDTDLDPGWNGAWLALSIQQPSSQEFDWRDFLYDPIKGPENDSSQEMLTYQDPFFGDPAGPGAGAAPASYNSGSDTMAMTVAASTNSLAVDKVVKCEKCDQQSNLAVPMRGHKGRCNPKINRRYQYVCNIGPCNMRFPTPNTLGKHKAHHNCEGVASMPLARSDNPTTVAIPVTTPVTTDQAADQTLMLPAATTTVTTESAAHALTGIATHADSRTKTRKRKLDASGNNTESINKASKTDQTLDAAELYGSLAVLAGNQAGRAATPIDFTNITSTATTVSASTNSLAEGPGFHSATPERVVEESTPGVRAVRECPKCKCISNLERVMSAHIVRCNPDVNRFYKYECDFDQNLCTMRFEILSYKDRHMNGHTTLAIQECPKCKCISNLSHAIAMHKKTCNPDKNRFYKHKCDFDQNLCTMRFNKLGEKIYHMNCHTGEYKCCYCNEEMHSSRKIKDHKKTCERRTNKKVKRVSNTAEREERKRNDGSKEGEEGRGKRRETDSTLDEAELYKALTAGLVAGNTAGPVAAEVDHATTNVTTASIVPVAMQD